MSARWTPFTTRPLSSTPSSGGCLRSGRAELRPWPDHDRKPITGRTVSSWLFRGNGGDSAHDRAGPTRSKEMPSGVIDGYQPS